MQKKFCLFFLKKRCEDRQLVIKISIRNVTEGKQYKTIVNILVVVVLPVQGVDSTPLTDITQGKQYKTIVNMLVVLPGQGMDSTCTQIHGLEM